MSNNFNEDGEEEYPAIAQAASAIVTPPAPDPLPELDVLDMDAVIAHTQKLRLKAIQKVNVALAQEVSSEMVSTLLKAASDMDKAVINRRRVGIDEEAAKTADQSQRDGAALLRAIGSKIFSIDPSQIDGSRGIPKLGDDIPLPVPVDGETDIGVHEMSYDAFAKTQQPSSQA